jgi:hypothetical protein
LAEHVSFWLKELVSIRANANPAVLKSKPPCGWIESLTPKDWDGHGGGNFDEGDLRFFDNSCFVQEQGPPQFSSGFHQVMPIIMQIAMMQRGEVLAIENPEVHLHPSAQLKVAEFLMHQALGGKTIVVETHSDLIIRRLIRAILDEEIKQEALNVQFVSLKTDETSRKSYSDSQSLRINDRDQIDNWPEGFMDDDLKESRRLFNIMYGRIRNGDAEEPQ